MRGAEAKRLAHLDGLRGLAALAVLYQHLVEYLGALAPVGSLMRQHAEWTLSFLDLGKLGVVVFFAISGYIVPFSFDPAAPRLGFVVSRIFRLYPAYWTSLAAAVLLLPTLGAAPFSTAQVLANATMVQGLLGKPDVLGVYWTLLIEVLFYALCFVLFCAGRLGSARTLAALLCTILGIAVVSAFLRASGVRAAPVGLPLYVAIMLFGACLRLATLEGDRQAKRYVPLLFVALIVALPLAWATAFDDNSHKESVLADISAFTLGLAIFVWVVYRRALALRWLIHAGAISYSVYLFHPLTLEFAEHLATPYSWPASGWIQVMVTLTLTWLVAYLVYRYIERPSIRFGKRLLPVLARSFTAQRKLPAD